MVAAADRRDPWHLACHSLLSSAEGPLYLPQTVVAEVAYFLQERVPIEAEITFLEDVATGRLLPTPVEPGDWERIAELVWRYRDLHLDTVDASIVAIAERMKITRIATLDRHHFEVVKPRHIDRFELVP